MRHHVHRQAENPYQPPEGNPSSHNLTLYLARRVARIILTASSLAALLSEGMRPSQKINFTRLLRIRGASHEKWVLTGPILFQLGQLLKFCRARLWCLLRDGLSQSLAQNRGLLKIE